MAWAPGTVSVSAGHLPSRGPALRYLRVQRGHSHGPDRPGQLEGREASRLGGRAGGSEARGRVTVSAAGA